MKTGNVLVIGNSGVGKSTLINAVLGKEAARTGWGSKGTTDELEIYNPEDVPFRIIDSVGFEPSFFKQQRAINAVKNWSKKSVKDGLDTQINVIWFCVDGTSAKLFPEAIRNLSCATSMWSSVPVIVVITKSYSVPDRERNIHMVNNVFAKQKKYANNLKGVIPVVASTFSLNETAFAAPEGITELIDLTNECMPEGIQAAEVDIAAFKLKRKRALAHGIVASSTTAGTVVGAVPVPMADGAILAPLEVGMINAIAKIYDIDKGDQAQIFKNSIVEVGTVGAAAKGAISAIKAIPGIGLAASALNAIVAGIFVAAIGEASVYAFEQVYLGKKKLEDVDWVKKLVESKMGIELVDQFKLVARDSSGIDAKKIGKLIYSVVRKNKKGE